MTSIQSYLISFYTPAMPSQVGPLSIYYVVIFSFATQSIVQHSNSIHAEAFDQAINSTIEVVLYLNAINQTVS